MKYCRKRLSSSSHNSREKNNNSSRGDDDEEQATEHGRYFYYLLILPPLHYQGVLEGGLRGPGVFNKRISKVRVSCSRWCPLPRAAQHLMYTCISSSGSKTGGESRALGGGAVSVQKALQGCETETRELLGGKK